MAVNVYPPVYIWVDMATSILQSKSHNNHIRLVPELEESIAYHANLHEYKKITVLNNNITNKQIAINGISMEMRSLTSYKDGSLDEKVVILECISLIPYMIAILNPLKNKYEQNDKEYQSYQDQINNENAKIIKTYKQSYNHVLCHVDSMAETSSGRYRNNKPQHDEEDTPVGYTIMLCHSMLAKLLLYMKYNEIFIGYTDKFKNTKFDELLSTIDELVNYMHMDNNNKIIFMSCNVETLWVTNKNIVKKYMDTTMIPTDIREMRMFLDIEIQLIGETLLEHTSNKIRTIIESNNKPHYIVCSPYNFDIYSATKFINSKYYGGEQYHIKSLKDFDKLKKYGTGKPTDTMDIQTL